MRGWLVVAALLCPSAALADDLASLLARGPVCLVETNDSGRVKTVTAIAKIDATPDQVWTKIVGFADYVHWMPQVAQSNVVSDADGAVVVDWSISAPGPDVNFEAKYVLDPAAKTVTGTWVSGALEGSHWEWKVEADGAGTRVYRTTYSSAVADNWLLKQFDDDAHTLELGLNAAAPIVELQALDKAVH